MLPQQCSKIITNICSIYGNNLQLVIFIIMCDNRFWASIFIGQLQRVKRQAFRRAHLKTLFKQNVCSRHVPDTTMCTVYHRYQCQNYLTLLEDICLNNHMQEGQHSERAQVATSHVVILVYRSYIQFCFSSCKTVILYIGVRDGVG